jgi:hypothetical protein
MTARRGKPTVYECKLPNPGRLGVYGAGVGEKSEIDFDVDMCGK